MTDIVERLRDCDGFHRAALIMLTAEAADEIESLRQQVHELSALLDCVKSERDQQLDEQKRLLNLVYRSADPLKKQLAECQAQKKVLRDGLKPVVRWLVSGCNPQDAAQELRLIIAMPSDSTALDTLLAAAELKGRREALLEAANVVGSQKYDTLLDMINELRRMAKELE